MMQLTKKHVVDGFVNLGKRREAAKTRIGVDDPHTLEKMRGRRVYRPSDAPASISKAELHLKKVSLSVWWDAKGIIHSEVLPLNQIIKATFHSQELNRLHSSLVEIRPGLINRNDLILHHDNAISQAAVITRQKLTRAMITNCFIPELNNHDVQELWFQQDGATCHTARATIDLLKDTFGDRLISRFGPVNWPPRSCD
ncbi:mariner transposase [Trichonephila clavipes]|uniref:Mariner transposase n=1 Tax=Trichonephila clavipes TaxID=2585209 RepID=A0A8X6VT15_TRICX|nr:mariner transposase [Trichonephila clavipes]